jgi:molybdopterin/thiamine biosynthesis adenylyltransferase
MTISDFTAPALFVAVILLILLYFYGLGKMRNAARERQDAQAKPVNPDSLTPTELDRYARHIVLREIGGPGQKKLRKAKVLVIGAGGLGAPVLQYLAAAGVGTIGVIDDDTVSLSNLQRQVLFDEDLLGKPKVFAAQQRLKLLNPFVTVLPYNRRLTPEIAEDLFAEYDLVLDGTDTFASRHIVNAACVATKTPLVWGAISQWEGQVTVFDPASGAPCFQCVFPKPPAEGQAPTCAEAGVMGALPGVVGSMMATEAIKLITGAGTVLKGELLIFDALEGQTRKIRIQRDAGCAVCGG